MTDEKQKFIIVGGGPVGFTVALLLARHGIPCDVYERRALIPDDPQESYPIGVNPRGLHTLSLIAPELCEQMKSLGTRVDSWQVFIGTRRVGMNESGVTYGTSRARINLLLADAAQGIPLIQIHYGHKLAGIDFDRRTLTFDIGGEAASRVCVDASQARIIAADGVNSMVRRALEAHDPDFRVKSTPWTYEFRVLFGKPGATIDKLDANIHYICNGQYVATVDYAGQQQWSCVTCVRDRDAPQRRSLFFATHASRDNMDAMRAKLKELVPWFYPLLPENEEGDAELRSYFGRRTFRGAIVRTNRLHYQEWIVLLGDAAHSVLPPTGEGLNSGLEDAAVLVHDCVLVNPENAFAAYNARRFKDVQALLDYAAYLNDDPWFSGERIARLFFLIAEASANPSVTDYLFGTLAVQRKPYNEFISAWNRRRLIFLCLFRLVAYPIGLLVELLTLPWTIVNAVRTRKMGAVDHTLKPSV